MNSAHQQQQQQQHLYQNQQLIRSQLMQQQQQQQSQPLPPLRSSSNVLLQQHWNPHHPARIDSPRLPVISEQEVVLSPLSMAAAAAAGACGGGGGGASVSDDLSFSDTNSQRLPSYNEPKPIIPEKVPQGGAAGSSSSSKEPAMMVPLMNMVSPPESSGGGNQLFHANHPHSSKVENCFQETDLDSFSQHAYGAINVIPKASTSSAANAVLPSEGFFVFDKNSSIAIKSQVMLNEQLNGVNGGQSYHHHQPNPFFSPSNLSPSHDDHRHHHRAPPSLADTTKATIQSVESDLDQMMLNDDDDDLDASSRHHFSRRGNKNEGGGGGGGHNMSQLEDASYIYNISSNESDHSVGGGGALSDSPYGHIIKRSSQLATTEDGKRAYAKECIENGFYKNSSRNRGKKVANNGGRWNRDGGLPENNNDGDKDDYCVFVRRDHPPPPPLLPKKADFQKSSHQHHRSSSSNHHHHHHSKNHHHFTPTHSKPSASYLENRTSRHYQAHNSPLIVHRFYHIDDETDERKGLGNKQPKRSATKLSTANHSSPFNAGGRRKTTTSQQHHQSHRSHRGGGGRGDGPSSSSKFRDGAHRPLMAPLGPFASRAAFPVSFKTYFLLFTKFNDIFECFRTEILRLLPLLHQTVPRHLLPMS